MPFDILPAKTVIIADDHNLFSDGLERIVNSSASFRVIAKAKNGSLLIRMLAEFSPDIVLVDINMPVMNGFETASAIRKNYPGIKIILISIYYDVSYDLFIEKHRIHGFITKDTDADQLINALHKVAEGHQVFLLPVVTDMAAAESAIRTLFKLTKTEIEIIKHIADGNSSKIIAHERKLSYLTVESHRKNIFKKLNAKNVADVVAFAVSKGLYKNKTS